LIGKEQNVLNQNIKQMQEWIIKTLTISLNDKEKSGLAQAILIGYRANLDNSLLVSYTNTGVVHVIAISGLHVGLIFSIISLLIKKIVGPRIGKFVSLFTALPIIWWFSILTGSSASVVRSALMSTISIIGNAFEKKPSTLNSLLASGFIQIIDDPNVILDLGFQLSYAAVASILIFNPLLNKIVYVKNPLVKVCLDMIFVTLSAQILTTPITIYYFHQFPVLFLLTNIIAVPLSSIILLAELILCLLKIFEFGIKPIAFCINFLIGGMNEYIRKIEAVPFSMVDQVYIGLITFLMMYIFLVTFFLI
jgi:competence protein ComEC